uniref:Uncharacterized protein n=1 Tax=Anopheles albimanus TaxID=7167 RepID=A0A182FX37_ANOAL
EPRNSGREQARSGGRDTPQKVGQHLFIDIQRQLIVRFRARNPILACFQRTNGERSIERVKW